MKSGSRQAGVLAMGVTALVVSGCGGEKAARPIASEGTLATAAWTSGAWTPGTPPRFEDFPAEPAGEPLRERVDLSSHPASAARAELLRQAAVAGPNFAGHLAIVSWEEPGRTGRSFLILDLRTGRVHPGADDVPPMEYRRESRLIRYAAPEPLPERVRCAGCIESFEVWHAERLHPIPPELWLPSEPPPAAMDELIAAFREEETALLARHSPEVLRPTWDRLVITAGNGRRRVFADEVVETDLRSTHGLASVPEPLNVFAIVRQYVPEGRTVLMVDRGSGDVVELDDLPVPSPRATRFATASADLVAGHAPNRIRVYRVGPEGPARSPVEWETSPQEWGARDPVWLDENTVELERVVVDWNTHGTFASRMRLRREPGGWGIEASVEHARDALLSFLSALGAGAYIEAAMLYGGTYEQLRTWNPDHDPEDLNGLWALGCERNGLQCVGRADILGTRELSTTETLFTARLLTPSGEPVVLGPCCGETERSMPPVREFDFRVMRVGNRYLVLDLPPYMP